MRLSCSGRDKLWSAIAWLYPVENTIRHTAAEVKGCVGGLARTKPGTVGVGMSTDSLSTVPSRSVVPDVDSWVECLVVFLEVELVLTTCPTR